VIYDFTFRKLLYSLHIRQAIFREFKMLTNQEITFENMATRFGEIAAYEYLEHIERAALMQPQRSIENPEIRLACALRVQDELRQSTLLMAA
jgi:hypothetical protein